MKEVPAKKRARRTRKSVRKPTAREPKRIWRAIVFIALVVLAVWYLNQSRIPQATKEEVAQLTSVDEYVGNGTVARSFDGKKFSLSVTAFLGKPAAGKFYEVWLVNESLAPKEISLGRMQAAGDVFSLSYTAETDYSEHNEVLITEERQDDGQPEKQLLRGTF